RPRSGRYRHRNAIPRLRRCGAVLSTGEEALPAHVCGAAVRIAGFRRRLGAVECDGSTRRWRLGRIVAHCQAALLGRLLADPGEFLRLRPAAFAHPVRVSDGSDPIRDYRGSRTALAANASLLAFLALRV